MNPNLLPVFQVTLPLIVTFVASIWGASWIQNKRFGDLNDRFADLNRQVDDLRSDLITRLDRIERKLDNHDERLVRLEERTSPLLGKR
jgi:hypothetical protein